MTLELHYRTVVSGLEGAGKSSCVFELLKELATTESPILFGCKNYTLMEEQIENWSEKYSIPKDEFAICGWYTNYERANQAYTNSEIPFLLGENTRFVFTTQAQIQRNRHTEFVRRVEEETLVVNWQYIVIDEFDYTTSLIPTLDYYFSRVKEFGPNEEISKLKRQKFEWIAQNYTYADVRDIQIKQTFAEIGFTIAHWVKETKCPLIFLTSETLAKNLLLALPEKELNSERFVEVNIASPDFKNCIVNVYHSPYINKHFFDVFCSNSGWFKSDFDYVISDNINSWYESQENLEVKRYENAISHMAVKGSNSFMGKNLLTIISHIPDYKIKQVKDTFEYFGNTKYEFEEIKALFYRDRVCQSIGRVLGHRKGKETFLVIHKNLLTSLQVEDFPYSLNLDWQLDFEEAPQLMQKVEERSKTRKAAKKEIKNKNELVAFSMLDDYFEIKSGETKTVAEIKEYVIDKSISGLSGRKNQYMPVSKIAAYFGVPVKNIKNKRSVVGLRFKNV